MKIIETPPVLAMACNINVFIIGLLMIFIIMIQLVHVSITDNLKDGDDGNVTAKVMLMTNMKIPLCHCMKAKNCILSACK